MAALSVRNQFLEKSLGFLGILALKSFRVTLYLGFKSGRYKFVSLSSFQVLTMLFLRRLVLRPIRILLGLK